MKDLDLYDSDEDDEVSSDSDEDQSRGSNRLQLMEETKEVPLARDDQTVHAALTHSNQPHFAGHKRKRTETELILGYD